jgi:hypothetical protein
MSNNEGISVSTGDGVMTLFCNKNLTEPNRRFLYDAEIVAGSPHRFEKHPQEFPIREQVPCKNESRLSGNFDQGALFLAQHK